MRLRNIILCMMAWLAMATLAQPVMNQQDWEWYLGEVVNDVFVGRNYFEYYYTPSNADMEQQRSKGEVTYFLNTPEGLNSKKVRDMIDRMMASYDDIRAVNNWQVTNTTYWKEFRFEKNKFRFTVKRKALDDGTYYVSATETANYYKSLKSSNSQRQSTRAVKEKKASANDKPSKRSRRRVITQDDVEAAEHNNTDSDLIAQDDEAPAPVVSEKERRQAAREREQALEQERRLAKRRAREQQREEAQKQKETEKQKKAEEKKQKEDEKRLAQEQKKQQREQAKLEREQVARNRKQATQQQAAQSKYHYSDIALWLSEKYDFTQTAAGQNSCTMYSTAVKDVEMAKLAIKNALKGSNARMAVPWRVNSETQAIETGYTVDDQVLVFSIGKDADERISLTVTEVGSDEFEQFKQSLNGF